MEVEHERKWTMDDLPTVMTEPCFRHFEADAQVGWTIASAAQLAVYVSHLFMGWAEDYIHALPRSGANFEASTYWHEKSKDAHYVGVRSEQLNLQVQLTRAVGSFLSYLTEIISLLLYSDPSLLSATDRALYDEFQGCPDQKERLRDLIEKRMAALSYGGMDDIQKAVEKQLDFRLFEDSEKMHEVTRAIAERNLIIHSRAVADAKFLRRMAGHTTLKHGEPLVLEQAEVSTQLQVLRVAVADIDARVGTRFALPRTITAQQFYERVQIPLFIGDWESTYNDDDPLLARIPEAADIP
jgi:hypothetical protein